MRITLRLWRGPVKRRRRRRRPNAAHLRRWNASGGANATRSWLVCGMACSKSPPVRCTPAMKGARGRSQSGGDHVGASGHQRPVTAVCAAICGSQPDRALRPSQRAPGHGSVLPLAAVTRREASQLCRG